jgi:hypothetical protein
MFVLRPDEGSSSNSVFSAIKAQSSFIVKNAVYFGVIRVAYEFFNWRSLKQ